MEADLAIRLRRGRDGSVVASGRLITPPFWCRWDGATLWIVGSAACPVGEDAITFSLDVGCGVDATVRTVAATILYTASGGGTSIDTRLRVADGATLRWQPEPVIVTPLARHRSTMRLDAEQGASVCVDEITVMGRSDERCGSVRSSLRMWVDDSPRLRNSFDSSLPGWDGPGGTGGARIYATRMVWRPDDRGTVDGVVEPTPPLQVDRPPRRPDHAPRAAVLSPEGGGHLAVALADDVGLARIALDEFLPFEVLPFELDRPLPVPTAAATTISGR